MRFGALGQSEGNEYCGRIKRSVWKKDDIRSENPAMEVRDWIVCSKVTRRTAIYAEWFEGGFFPMEWLDT